MESRAMRSRGQGGGKENRRGTEEGARDHSEAGLMGKVRGKWWQRLFVFKGKGWFGRETNINTKFVKLDN